MSITADLAINIHPTNNCSIFQVLTDLSTFIHKVQESTHYKINFDPANLNQYRISYDRCEHFKLDDIVSASTGLFSFTADLFFKINDGEFRVYQYSVHCGSQKSVSEPIESTFESFENSDVESLHEDYENYSPNNEFIDIKILNDFVQNYKDFDLKRKNYTGKDLETFKNFCTLLHKYYYVYDKYLINFSTKTACPLSFYDDTILKRSADVFDKGGYKNTDEIQNEVFNTKIKVLSIDELKNYDFTELFESLKESYNDFDVLSCFYYLAKNDIFLKHSDYICSKELMDKSKPVLIFYRDYFENYLKQQ